MNTGLKGALATAGLVLGFATTTPTAKADPITATYEGISSGVGNAGQARWNTGGTAYPAILYNPSSNNFISFCIERSQGLPTGTHTYDLSSLGGDGGAGPSVMASDAATALRSMWAEYRSDLDTAEESAAFQHAIWKLIDPGYDPGLSGTLAALFALYLDPATWQSGLARLGVLTNPNLQDQVVELVPPNVESIPEPAPPALLVALLMAPALLLRRKLAAGKGA